MTQKNAGALQRQNKLKSLKSVLQSTSKDWLPTVPRTMSSYLTAERLCHLMILAASKKGSSIMDCTHQSVVRCVADAVSMGLEPNGPLGHAYLVPFKNNGVMEAQLIIGYRGLIAMARRSGEITSVEAYVVYADDEFELCLGINTTIVHRPTMAGDRSLDRNIIAVYCVAHFKDGGHHMDFMTRAEIDRVMKMSKTAHMKGSAWQEHYAEMAKKTVVRRAAKYWPLSSDIASALTVPDESSAENENENVIDMEFEEDAAEGPQPAAEEQAPEEEAPTQDAGGECDTPTPQTTADESPEDSTEHYRQRVQKMVNKT